MIGNEDIQLEAAETTSERFIQFMLIEKNFKKHNNGGKAVKRKKVA
jgi:hypothetical protein